MAISDRRFSTLIRFISLIACSRWNNQKGENISTSRAPGSGRRQFEHLPQISQIGGIITHGVFWCIRHFCHRLAVAADHFHDYLQRSEEPCVGEGWLSKCRYRWSAYH